ncbi:MULTISPECIES: hypothetical protein [Bacillus cereus group]|nr:MULTISPECIES: hypothetical protein [Bacillus cereus group]
MGSRQTLNQLKTNAGGFFYFIKNILFFFKNSFSLYIKWLAKEYQSL